MCNNLQVLKAQETIKVSFQNSHTNRPGFPAQTDCQISHTNILSGFPQRQTVRFPIQTIKIPTETDWQGIHTIDRLSGFPHRQADYQGSHNDRQTVRVPTQADCQGSHTDRLTVRVPIHTDCQGSHAQLLGSLGSLGLSGLLGF